MTDHRDWADSSEPALSQDPTDTTDAADPTDPTDSTDPTDPMDSTDPTDPMERTESRDQRESLDMVPIVGVTGPGGPERSGGRRLRATRLRW